MNGLATVHDVSTDPDLARRLAAAGRKAVEWKNKRDELIQQAAREGATLREIAALVGLTNPGVLRIVRKGEDVPEYRHTTPLSQGGDPDDVVFVSPNENRKLHQGE